MTISLATGGMISDLTFTGVINTFPVTINGVRFPPLEAFRNDKKKFEFTIKDSNGDPFSLNAAGAKVTFTGKLNIADPDSAAIFSELCTITDPVNGVCEVTLTAAQTAFTGVTDRIVIVELFYEDSSTDLLKETLAQGELTINADVLQT